MSDATETDTQTPSADDATAFTDHDALGALASSVDDGPEPDPSAPGGEPQGMETKVVMRGLLEPTLLILTPNWQYQPAELDALATSYADVLDKYVPDGIGNLPEVTAALITLGIFLPRLRSGVPPRGEPEPAEEPEKPADGELT